MQPIRLSASAIADYKACPLRYKLAWLYRLEQDKEKDSLRIGEMWHRCHEIINMKPGDICPDCRRQQEIWPQCPLCDGKGILPAELGFSVVRYLDKKYEQIPDGKTYDDWRTEQLTILRSLFAYRWLYGQGSQYEPIASEIWFELPIIDPSTGKKMQKAKFVGKIDQLIRDKQNGLVYIFERKSTSQSLDSGQYWNRLRLDTQITGYLWAARVCQQLGKFGKDWPPIQGVFYDVWHKPDIKPRKTTNKEHEKWLASKTYYKEPLETWPENGFETPEMYASRLSADICERPEHYFASREIPRQDSQLVAFEIELANLVKHIRYVDKNNLWFSHDRMCEVPFYCEFRSLCYSGQCVKPDDVPEGYRRKK